MSKRDFLERVYDVYNRGAWDEDPSLVPHEFVYHPPAHSLHPEAIVGPDALLAYFEPDLFERQWVEVREIVENGDLALASLLGGGLTISGARLEQPIFQVWRFEGDAPRESWLFTDRADAERAAGLRD